jgi:hypothetical protein
MYFLKDLLSILFILPHLQFSQRFLKPHNYEQMESVQCKSGYVIDIPFFYVSTRNHEIPKQILLFLSAF